MRGSLRANIELVTQVVVAIAIVITAGVLVKRTVFPLSGNGARLPQISAGDRLDLPHHRLGAEQKDPCVLSEEGLSLLHFKRKLVPPVDG